MKHGMPTLVKFFQGVVLVFARHIYELFSPRETDLSSIYFSVPASRGLIPNTVFQTWKTPLLPSLQARGMRRFRNANPDYSFSFYDDAAMSTYMETHYAGHPILPVFRDLRIPAARADVWRYCILYREGGVYCDIDSALGVPLRQVIHDDMSELISFESNLWRDSFDPAYADSGVFMSAPPPAAQAKLEHPDHLVLNWLLCFEKGHPVLGEAIGLIVRHFPFFQGKQFASVWKAVIHCTGPLALTQAVWAWLARSERKPAQCGIDYGGQGVFKLPGSGRRDAASPHYVAMRDSALTR